MTDPFQPDLGRDSLPRHLSIDIVKQRAFARFYRGMTHPGGPRYALFSPSLPLPPPHLPLFFLFLA